MKTANRKNKVFGSIALLGFLLFFLAFMPGFLSPDSIDQYEQSISGAYTDWHPIAMAMLWSAFNSIYAGGELMLALQLFMYWFSYYLLARNLPKRLSIATTVLFILAPFLINFSGYIIKDAQLALSWLLACSILLQSVFKNRPLRWAEVIISAVLIVYGLLVRIDAFAGFIPLLVLWVWTVFDGKKPRFKVGVSFAAIVLVASLYQLLAGIPSIKKYPEAKLLLHDLSGIYVETGEDVFPRELYLQPNGFDTAYVRKHYHTATFDMLWWNSDGVPIKPDMNEGVSSTLKESWWLAVRKHPSVYLKNRFDGYLYYLRLKTRGDNNMTHYVWVHPNEVGLVQKPNALRGVFVRWLDNNRSMFYMQAWFWFFLNIALIAVTYAQKNRVLKQFCYAILTSSLLYRLIQFFVFQIDTDFRYFYWTCIACTIAVILNVLAYTKKSFKHP